MEQLDNIAQIIALTMGVAWASGINLYAAVAMLGILGASGQMALPEDLQVLSHPMVLGSAILMYCVEFFADKVPGVDTGWDVIHTFIRIPAGAMLAAGAVGEIGPAAQLAAGLVGGGLATATHAAKMGTRAAINTSPEPFSNWTASVAEDAAVFSGLWLALNHPWLFVGFLALFILLLVWLLPRLWRLIVRAFSWLSRRFGASTPAVTENNAVEAKAENPVQPQ